MDRLPCMCLPFGTAKAGRGGAGGNEVGKVGTPEAGLSGFEAGRSVLPIVLSGIRHQGVTEF